MLNALTFDVEDYYQVENLSSVVSFNDWDRFESRVEKNTERVLSILETRKIKVTFFVLAWIAEKFPSLINKISKEGHEIACHGYAHQRIIMQDKESFREDLRKAKHILEDITGLQIKGYRAPTYSITKETIWALDILIEEEFIYDSSIFPILHPDYGIPDATPYIHKISREGTGSIIEFPPSTLKIFGRNFPVAGGGYLRFLPSYFIGWGIKKINLAGYPAMIYLHPWELDPDQPRMPIKGTRYFRHYVNLEKTEKKLLFLLERFSFKPVEEIIRSYLT